MASYDLDRGQHSVHSLYYHFIQVAKYRKKVFSTFIVGRTHKKSRYKRRVPTDFGEFMPVEELANTLRQASPGEAGSPMR